MGACVQATSVSLPDAILSNEDLAARHSAWTADRISKKLGIDTRHVLGENQTASELAIAAARALIEEDRNHADVDYLLFCTQAPDYALPTTACLIHRQLELRRDVGAIDINQGCSGYIHGLALASSLVKAGVARKVMLLTADAYSKFVGPEDAGTRTIFGDAGTATIVGQCEKERIGDFLFGTDGSGAEHLILLGSGFRKAPEAKSEVCALHMNGPEVLSFTLREVPPLAEKILANAGLQMEELDFVLMHQANKFILQQLQRKLGVSRDQMIIEMADVGNTVSSTIPLAFHRARRDGRIKPGDRGLLLGFGVGLSWGGCIIEA